MGLILAGAYLGGGLAKAAPDQTAPVPQAAQTVAVAAAPSAPAMRKASFAAPGPAAKPFRSAARSDLDCLTEAVYYEARGEGPSGQAAVAQVVLNRVRHPSFPKSVCAVVFQGCQFSFACDGSMRARREGRAWNRAQRIATDALSGAVMANVGNATHFHTVNVSPNWGSSLMRVGQVGLHIFYRFSGRNGRPGVFTAEAVPSAPEPGLYEYARLAPGETVYMTSAVTTPKLEVAIEAQPGVGGPIGPVTEPASAPSVAATPAPEVKVSADTLIRTSKPTSTSAS